MYCEHGPEAQQYICMSLRFLLIPASSNQDQHPSRSTSTVSQVFGNGAIRVQQLLLPLISLSVGLDAVVGGGNGSPLNINNGNPDSSSGSKSNSVVGGIAILIISAIMGVCVARKNLKGPSSKFAMAPTTGTVPWYSKEASICTSVLTPLQCTNYDDSWDLSTPVSMPHMRRIEMIVRQEEGARSMRMVDIPQAHIIYSQ